MEFIYIIGGAIASAAVTCLIIYLNKRNSARGYFKIDVVDKDEGTYSINICIPPEQDLLNKKTVILERDPSQR